MVQPDVEADVRGPNDHNLSSAIFVANLQLLATYGTLYSHRIRD